MLDINFIRENPNKVEEACEKKQVKVDVDKILELDKENRKLITEKETLSAYQNQRSDDIRNSTDEAYKKKTILKLQECKEKIKKIKEKQLAVEEALKILLLQLPNIPFDDVPVGKDDSQNVIMRQVGRPSLKLRNDKPRNYMQLGQDLDLIDTERAGKISGSRFGFIKNELALLEFALINLALDTVRKEGFKPVIPPVMVKEEMARGTGYFEAGDKDEAYFLQQDNMFLVGTSEQSLIAMHANEILDEKKLPLRYVGFSTCFRREAGSYGKDTKGILRVHQFDKLEMVIFSKTEDSKKEHQLILKIEEKLMKLLDLPYQVINICTGDLGRPAAAKYDIETWLPSENKYRETHSCSNCTDFQARRLNIRYKDKAGKMQFLHTLNGTAFAIGRILIMLMENYQQKDGSIKVPRALQKYCGFSRIAGIK